MLKLAMMLALFPAIYVIACVLDWQARRRDRKRREKRTQSGSTRRPGYLAP